MVAPEAMPDLETLPRFLHLPFLGFYYRLGTEAELQPFPCGSAPEHSQPPLIVPSAAIPGGDYSHHSRGQKKWGSWRCSACCRCTTEKSEPEPGSLSRSRCSWACCGGPVLLGWEWIPQSLQAPACSLTCPRQGGATAWAPLHPGSWGKPGGHPQQQPPQSELVYSPREASTPPFQVPLLTQGPFVLELSLPFPHTGQLSVQDR